MDLAQGQGPGLGVILFGVTCLLALLASMAFLFINALVMRAVLSHISPEHREMEACSTWMMLIPVFGHIWLFVLIGRLSGSIRKAFQAQEMTDKDPDFGRNLGWVMGACLCLTTAGYLAMPLVGIVAALPTLAFGVLWWLKVVGYGRKLAA